MSGHPNADKRPWKGDANLMNTRRARGVLLTGSILCVVLFLPLSMLSARLDTHAQESRASDACLAPYPGLPETVVEAFCKVDYDGIADEDIGDVRKRLRYTTSEVYPGYDCVPIALGYKVMKHTEEANEASVKVAYRTIGHLCGYESLRIEESDDEVTYRLQKREDLWKIYHPILPPHISIETAVKILNKALTRSISKRDPTIRHSIEKNIATLKQIEESFKNTKHEKKGDKQR